jgi:hypothetical protein
MPLRPTVGWVLLAALMPALALPGCLGCHPHLDVRLCRPGSATCAPGEGDRVADWNPDLAPVFPDVARLIEEVPLGKHLHAEWTAEQEQAFWRFWDVPLDDPEKQVFLRHEGGLYRVRVLSC